MLKFPEKLFEDLPKSLMKKQGKLTLVPKDK